MRFLRLLAAGYDGMALCPFAFTELATFKRAMLLSTRGHISQSTVRACPGIAHCRWLPPFRFALFASEWLRLPIAGDNFRMTSDWVLLTHLPIDFFERVRQMVSSGHQFPHLSLFIITCLLYSRRSNPAGEGSVMVLAIRPEQPDWCWRPRLERLFFQWEVWCCRRCVIRICRHPPRLGNLLHTDPCDANPLATCGPS